jgi:hypothetical protein
MLGEFCFRLACGLVCSLLLLSPAQINPRFFRIHFLLALCLIVVAAIFLRQVADFWAWGVLSAALTFAFLGALSWSVEKAPGGRSLIMLASISLLVALGRYALLTASEGAATWKLAGEITSAAVLGTATTAMLMGHSYLIAPAMSLTPLLRLVASLFAALLARALVSGLAFWTSGILLGKLDDTTMILPVRWGLGLVLPLILTGMAWQTARMRSTQSATGILYVAVIFCFVGELTGQLLYQWNGSML